MTLSADERVAIEARSQRPCVWGEGEVPRHVAEYLWDAVHDRHALLAALVAAEAERDDLLGAWRPVIDAADAWERDPGTRDEPNWPAQTRLVDAVRALRDLRAKRGAR